jgi:hypothetical protein
MKKPIALAALTLALVLAGEAAAGDRHVRITKKDGSTVEGVLEARKDHVYALESDGGPVTIPESEVLRVDFLDEAKPGLRPFESVKTGDWWCYELSDWLGRTADTSLAEDADGETLKLRLFPAQMLRDIALGGKSPALVERSVDGFAWLASLGVAVTSSKTEADRRTVLGRTFECTKVSVSLLRRGAKHEEKRIPMEVQAWFGRSGAPPIVALSIETTSDEDHPIGFKAELRGFGNKDATEWGKKAADLEPKIPSNLFAKATVGDWFVYVLEMGTTTRRRHVLTQRVTRVEGATRTIRSEGTGLPTVDWTADASTNALAMGGDDARPIVRDLAVVEERYVLEGKEYASWKVTFESTNPSQSDRHHPGHLTYRIVDGLGVCGLVSLHGVTELGYANETSDFTLEGYGHDDKTLWGKTAKELESAK